MFVYNMIKISRRKEDIELEIAKIKERNLSGEDTLNLAIELINGVLSLHNNRDREKLLEITKILEKRRKKENGTK